ncbi:uncharacterized protein METZ01_LOCUS151768, partial [marine metagenome]
MLASLYINLYLVFRFRQTHTDCSAYGD